MRYLFAIFGVLWFRFRLWLAVYRTHKQIARLEQRRDKLVNTGVFKWQTLLQIDKNIDAAYNKLHRYSIYHSEILSL